MRSSGLAWARVFARLSSTNTYAATRLADGSLPLGEGVVVALAQTAGRGRGGNRWWSSAGCLTVTFVLDAHGLAPQEVPLRAGLATLDVASGLAGPSACFRLKWPNDLLAIVDDQPRKIAGILCERVGGRDVVGIGLNLANDFSAAPDDVRRRAASLRELGAGNLDLAEVIGRLASALRESRRRPDWAQAFGRVHHLAGRAVTIADGDDSVSGVCTGIAEDGRLRLRVGEREVLVSSGTVTRF